MDLLSLVFTLRPLAQPDPQRPLPAWWGRAAQAMALSAIAKNDPALAAALHDEPGPRPLTASTLMGRFPQRHLDPQENYRLRITALTAPVCTRLMETVQPGGVLSPGATIELDYLPFLIQSVAARPEEQEWAAASSFQELSARYLLTSEPPLRYIVLQFTSPTAFHSEERTQPLPLPELVFGSLLQRWNAFSPLAFPQELRRYARECLAVQRFHIESRAVPYKENGLRVGFIGEVGFTVLNFDRYWLGQLHALAAFSLFSGVGVQTSAGMGQCRPLPPRAAEAGD